MQVAICTHIRYNKSVFQAGATLGGAIYNLAIVTLGNMVGGAIVMGIGVYILGSEKGKVNSLNNKAI